jgi:hypothetical protein
MLPTISNALTLTASRSKTYGTKLKSSSSPLPQEIGASTQSERKLPSINVSILLSSPVRSAYEKYLDAPKSQQNAVNKTAESPGGKSMFLTELLHQRNEFPESVQKLTSHEQVQQCNSEFLMTLDRVKELFDPKTSRDVFHYFVPLRSRDGYGNMYHVTKASNIETQKQDVYLTLSLFGVTQFLHGAPEYFDSIERYKRELLCFDHLKKLKLFGRYRLMKTFGLWKQAFRHRRVKMNAKNLAAGWRFERTTLQILLIELREKYLRLVSQMNFQLIPFDFPESVASFFDKISGELRELMLCVHNQLKETERNLRRSLEVFLNQGLACLTKHDPFKYTAWRKVRRDQDIANSCLILCDEMVSDFHVSIAVGLVKNILQCMGTGSISESQLGIQVHLKVDGAETFVPKMNSVGMYKNGTFKFELNAVSDDSFEIVPTMSEFTERYDTVVDCISELVQFPCKLRDKKIVLPPNEMSMSAVGRLNTAKVGSTTTPQTQQQRHQETSTTQYLDTNVVMRRAMFVMRLEPSFQLVNQLSAEFQSRRIALKDFRNSAIVVSREISSKNHILDLENLLREGHILMDEFAALSDSKLCGEFLVNCVDAKKSLMIIVPTYLNDICEAMLAHFSTTLKSTLDIAVEFTEVLAETTTIEQFLCQNEIVLNFRNERPATMAKMQYSKLCHEVCQRHLLDINAVDSAMSSILDEEFEKMEFCIEMFEANYEDNFIKFGNLLENNAGSIKDSVTALKNAIDDEMFDKETEFAHICLASITELKSRHDEITRASLALINQQKFFNQPECHFDGIVELGILIQFKLTVWNLITDLNDAIQKLSPQLVEKIGLKHFDVLAKKFQEVISSQNAPFELFERLKLRVSAFLDTLRVVRACQCPDLKAEHWDKIEIILGIRIDRENMSGHSQPFTFQSLVTSSAHQNTKEVVEVAQEAQYQNACKIKFDGIRESWSNCDFIVAPYKGKYDMFCLEKTDVIQHLLDNSLIELAQLMSSPYAKIIKADVQELLSKLRVLGDTLQVLLKLEAGWLHLEPIFNVGDIQRSLPTEFKLYSSTDRFRKGFLKSVLQFHNVMRNILVSGFTDSLKKQVDNLDRVSAGLKSYIAAKRAAFPRFFFASDGDLLSVMAKYKQYDAISEYINFFFRGVGSVQINTDIEVSVVAMVSTRGEVVSLLRPPKLRGTPDAWLNDLEESMQKQMSVSTKDAVAMYQDVILDRWAESAPCQILLLSLHMVMTKSIEVVLSSKKQDRMLELVAHIEQRISILFILLNMRISEIGRNKYELLLASYMRFASVLDQVRQSTEPLTSASFMWKCQLRVYWETADGKDQVMFRQLFSEIQHDFEFVGDQRLFVISTEINSQVISITNAVHSFTNCEIVGESGVGKTALTRHLADVFGKIAYTIQCLLPCQSAMLINAVIGSAVCNGWLFVENSMSLGQETLSVLVTYIETLKHMRGSKDDHVMLDGQAIHTAGTFQVFSINSSTARGNDQSWRLMNANFRLMQIMQPDMEEVCGIVFASAGFRNTSQLLSRKWLKLSKVSKDHLTHRCHNVFTLRVLKHILRDFCKTCNGERNEDLFWNFVSMFFRSILEKSAHAEFQRNLFVVVTGREPAVGYHANADSKSYSKETCKAPSLMITDPLLAGIVAACSSNRAILIMGEAKSGKSSVLTQLKNHLIYNDIAEGNKIERVFETIFPNAMEHADLIGGYELKTKKSTDGIFTEVLRRSCSERNISTMIIIDGVPCTAWTDYLIGYMESKNSVVISASEILHFARGKPRLIVETDCVMNAAPSFLDRLSTFFIQNESLMSFDFLAKEIAASFNAEVETKYVDFAWTGLFSKPFLMDCVDFVDRNFLSSKHQCRRLQFTACIKLFTGLVRSKYAFLSTQKLDIQEFMKKAFMIAVIWTVGGTPLIEERLKFADFFRSRYGTLDLPRFPNSATVYDYLINPETMAFCHCKDYVWCRQPEYFVAPFCIASVLIETQRASVVLLGQRYSGKSSLMLGLRARTSLSLKPEVLRLAFTGHTIATDVRCVIDSNLHRISKSVFGSTNGCPVLIEVDDMSTSQNRGTMNSATECIRQLLDGVDELRPRGTFLDMAKKYGRVAHVQLIASCDSKLDGNQNSRLLGHFIQIHLKPLGTENMKQIFSHAVEVGQGQPQAKAFLLTVISTLFDCFKSITHFWQTSRDTFWLQPTINDCTRIITSIADDVKSNDVAEIQWANVSMYHLSTVFMGMVTTLKCKEQITAILRLFYQNVYPTNPNSDQELHWFSFGTGLNPHPSTIASCETTREWIEEEISRFNNTNSPPLKIHLSNDLIRQMASFAKALSRNGSHLLVSSPSGYHKYGSFRLLSSMLRYTFWEFDLKLQSRDSLNEIIGRLYLAVGAEQDKALMYVNIDFNHLWDAETLSMLSDLHSLIETGDPANMISYEDRRKVVEIALHNAQSSRSSTIEAPEILEIIRSRLLSNFHLVFVANASETQMREQLFGFPAFTKKMTIFTRGSAIEWREQGEIISSLVDFLSGSSLNGNAKNQIANLLGALHRNILQSYDRFSRSNLISCAKMICHQVSKRNAEQESKQLSLKLSIKRVQEIADHLQTTKFRLQELVAEANETSQKNDELAKLFMDAQSDLTSVRETLEGLLSERKVKNAELQLVQEKVRIIMEPSQQDLQTCLQALRTLSKSTVNEFTSLENPEQCLQLVGILISLLFGEAPEWKSLRKINTNEGLQVKLFNYDFSSIPPRLGRQILKIIEVSKLDEKAIEKVSNVGKVLARWLLACIAALKVSIEFAKEIAARDDLVLIVQGIASQIECQKPALGAHKDEVDTLQIRFDFSRSKFKSLKESAEQCETIIMRCSKLLEAFENSVSDWKSQLDQQQDLEKSYIVDFVLACFFVSYLGVLDSKARQEVMGKSFDICEEENMFYNQDNVNKCLVASKIAYNEWIVCGLPASAFSLENGLSIRSSFVWPLIYDPNDIAANWIKRVEQRKNLHIFSCSEIKHSIVALEQAIIDGCPILLEDLPIEPPLWLGSLLTRRTLTKYSKTELLCIEGRDIAVGEGFRVYVTCKCPFEDLSQFYFGAMTPVNFEVNLETADAACSRLLASWCMQQSSTYADHVDMSFVHSVKQLLEIKAKRDTMLITPLMTMVEDDAFFIAALQSNLNLSMITTKLTEVQTVIDDFKLLEKKCNRISCAMASLFIASQKLKLKDERFSVSYQWFQELVAKLTEEVEFTDENSGRKLFQRFASSFFQCIAEMVPSGVFRSFVFDCAVTVCESEGREFDSISLMLMPKLCNCNISKHSWRFFVNRSKSHIPLAHALPEHPFLSIQQLEKIGAIDEHIPALTGISQSVYENQKLWRDWFENGRYAVQKSSPLALNSGSTSHFDSLVILCCLFPSNEYVFMEEFCSSVFTKEHFAHGLNSLSSKARTNFANLSYLLVEGKHDVDWKETIFEHLQFWGLANNDNLKYVEYSAQTESQVERRLSQIIRAKQHVIIENAFQKYTWLRMILTKLSKELEEEFVSRVYVVLPPNKFGTQLAPFYDTSRKVYCKSKLEFKDNVKLNSEIVLNFDSKVLNVCLRKALATFHSILGREDLFPNVSVKIGTRTLKNCLNTIETSLASVVDSSMTEEDENRLISWAVTAHYGGIARDEIQLKRFLQVLHWSLQIDNVFKHSFWTDKPDIDSFIKSLPTLAVLEFCGHRESKEFQIVTTLHQKPQILTSAAAREVAAIQLMVPAVILQKDYGEKKIDWFLGTEIGIYNAEVAAITCIVGDCLQCRAETDFKDMQSSIVFITQDKLPPNFPHQSQASHNSLRAYLSKLTSKRNYYLTWAQHGPPVCHDISVYYDVRSFLAHVYVGSDRTADQGYVFTLKVLRIENAGEISEVASKGVFVEGLLACRCKWDGKRRRFCSMAMTDDSCTKIPICLLSPNAEMQDADANRRCLPLCTFPLDEAQNSTEQALASIQVDIQDDSIDMMVASNASLACKRNA